MAEKKAGWKRGIGKGLVLDFVQRENARSIPKSEMKSTIEEYKKLALEYYGENFLVKVIEHNDFYKVYAKRMKK